MRYLVRKRNGRWQIVNPATGRVTPMSHHANTLPRAYAYAATWHRAPLMPNRWPLDND